MKLSFRLPSLPSSRNRSSPAVSTDLALVLALFWLLVAIYNLTYVGAFKSSDERFVFSALDSWVKRGELTMNQFYWAEDGGEYLAIDKMVGHYESGQLIAALPLYIWGRALGAAVQGTLFLNVFVTAFGACLLFLIARELGFRRRTAIIGTLVYALATPAWVYSRYFFREPLATASILLAIILLLKMGKSQKWWLLFPATLAYLFAMLTKLTTITFLPAFLLLSLTPLITAHRQAAKKMLVFALVVVLLVGIAIGAVFAWLKPEVSVAVVRRVEVIPKMLEALAEPDRIGTALFGMTFSPIRGLFVYAPALLLGILGAAPFSRKRSGLFIALLIFVLVHIGSYVAYPQWWGGLCWGPRLLLPIVPILVLFSLPVFESLDLYAGRRAGSLALCAIVLLLITSSVIQLLGILVDPSIYELTYATRLIEKLQSIDSRTIIRYMTYDWSASPIVGQLGVLLDPQFPLDLAWVQAGQDHTRILWLPLCAILVGIIGAGGLVRLSLRRTQLAPYLAIAALPACFTLLTFEVEHYRQGDPRLDPQGLERVLEPAVEYLHNHAAPDDVMIHGVPDNSDFLLNRLSAPIEWFGLRDSAYPIEPRYVELLSHLLHQRGSTIWLLRDRRAEADAQRGLELFLLEQAYLEEEWLFENWSRLLLFRPGGNVPLYDNSPLVNLGGQMLLQQYYLESAGDFPKATETGWLELSEEGGLGLLLRWKALVDLETDYTISVQLLNESGIVTWQNDRFPTNGLKPTSEWVTDEVIQERFFVPLNHPAGLYHLGLSVYDFGSMQRLTSLGRDFFPLADVEIDPIGPSTKRLRVSSAVDGLAITQPVFLPLLYALPNPYP